MIEDLNIDAAAENEFSDHPDPNMSEDPGSFGAAPKNPSFDFSFLKAKTGPGPIEDYIDHPLNTSGGRAVAQILRGLTGLAGALDLAIFDILLGALQFFKEKRGTDEEEKWHYVE